eukprot:jgi/Hompol1/720/HPOL_005426-RA
MSDEMEIDVDDDSVREQLFFEADEFRRSAFAASQQHHGLPQNSRIAPTKPQAGGPRLTHKPPNLVGTAIVIDTNVLIANLGLLSSLLLSLPSDMFLLVPHVVVNELDGLKASTTRESNGRDEAGRPIHQSLRECARKANQFLFTNLSLHPNRIRGQSKHDVRPNVPLEALSNDDQILELCLFYDEYVTRDVVLLSNDKNLCVKALMNSILTVADFRGKAPQLIDEILSQINKRHLRLAEGATTPTPKSSPVAHFVNLPAAASTFARHNSGFDSYQAQGNWFQYSADQHHFQSFPQSHQGTTDSAMHPMMDVSMHGRPAHVDAMDIDLDSVIPYKAATIPIPSAVPQTLVDAEAHQLAALKELVTLLMACAKACFPPIMHSFNSKAGSNANESIHSTHAYHETPVISNVASIFEVIEKKWASIFSGLILDYAATETRDRASPDVSIHSSSHVAALASSQRICDDIKARLRQNQHTANDIERSVRTQKLKLTRGDLDSFMKDTELIMCTICRAAGFTRDEAGLRQSFNVIQAAFV